jgi:hypothetical protein
MEDAALVYRLTRSAEKRIFSIPVGNIAPHQVPQYIQNIARQFKKTPFVDPGTGQINERYNPLIQDDDFFLPKRPDGSGPEIDTLPGAENLDQIADIEYFKKKMIAATKIPFSRVGIGEPSESDGKSLASTSPEFAKNIQWIQREVALGIKKMIFVHLSLRGHSVSDLRNFDVILTAASAIDELYRIETWNTRADIIGNLKETGMFPNYWILERFTDMTREEIDDMQKDMLSDAEKLGDPNAQGQGGPGAGAFGESIDDSEKELITEYAEYEKRLTAGRVIDLDDMVFKPNSKTPIAESAIDWFINNNELDALPCKEGNKPLVEWSVPEDQREQVLSETLMLLNGGEITPETIQEVVKEIEDDGTDNVISEGAPAASE